LNDGVAAVGTGGLAAYIFGEKIAVAADGISTLAVTQSANAGQKSIVVFGAQGVDSRRDINADAKVGLSKSGYAVADGKRFEVTLLDGRTVKGTSEGTIENIALSPDGMTYAIVRNIDGARSLVVGDMKTGRRVSETALEKVQDEIIFDGTGSKIAVVEATNTDDRTVTLLTTLGEPLWAVSYDVKKTEGPARLKQGVVGAVSTVLWKGHHVKEMQAASSSPSARTTADGYNHAGSLAIGRPQALGLMANPSQQRAVILAINHEVTRMSDTLKERIRATNKPYIPLLFIGGGPRQANLANELAKRGDMKGVALVVKEPTLAADESKFSPEDYERMSGVVSPKEIQDGEFTGQQINKNVAIQRATSINAYTSGVNFLMGETIKEVTRESDESSPARYKVTFESGLEVYTDGVLGEGSDPHPLEFALEYVDLFSMRNADGTLKKDNLALVEAKVESVAFEAKKEIKVEVKQGQTVGASDYDNSYALARLVEALGRDTAFTESGTVKIQVTRMLGEPIEVAVIGLAKIPAELEAALKDPQMYMLFATKLRHRNGIEFEIPIEKARSGRTQVIANKAKTTDLGEKYPPGHVRKTRVIDGRSRGGMDW
jgi:hypothetical protein